MWDILSAGNGFGDWQQTVSVYVDQTAAMEMNLSVVFLSKQVADHDVQMHYVNQCGLLSCDFCLSALCHLWVTVLNWYSFLQRYWRHATLHLKSWYFEWICALHLCSFVASSTVNKCELEGNTCEMPVQCRVANRPEFFGTVPNSAAVSRVPNGSIRDRLMSQIFTVQKVTSTRILISGF